MPQPTVHIAASQRYACIQCGRCCRRFHVLLREEEVQRLRQVTWPAELALPDDFVTRLKGHPHFRRRESGACVFLEEATGRCTMHQLIGYEKKALTCRGYPMNIASGFPGEVSVIARMDCPAVQQNHGPPLRSRRNDIEGLVRELGTAGGFTPKQLQGLERHAVEAVTTALVRMMTSRDDLAPGVLAAAMLRASERLQALGPTLLNDKRTLREVMPTLLERAAQEAAEPTQRCLGRFSRTLFRTWFATYCRRDEEVLAPTLARRLRQTAALAAIVSGSGNLKTLGWEHPDHPLKQVKLCRNPRSARAKRSSRSDWTCYRLLLQSRLEAPQFFGVSYYGEPFFTGLRALLLTYPLVLAAARVHAAAARKASVGSADVAYAVGAIDHCLGRSPLLRHRPWRSIEAHFSGPRFPALLNSLGWD